ncbi:Orexin receptor type 2 [Mactra antiquata]
MLNKIVLIYYFIIYITVLEADDDLSTSDVTDLPEVVTNKYDGLWDSDNTSINTEDIRNIENMNTTTDSQKPPWPTIPTSLNNLQCSVLKEYGGWSFVYTYSREEISGLLCRCKKICRKVTVSPEVKDDILDLLNNPLSELNLKEFVPIVTVYSIIFLVGVSGNILTIIGISTWMKKRSPTYAFIISLSCSDLLLLSICLPLKVTEYFHLGEVFTEFTCKLSYYLRDFTLTCSVLTLTVISFERYYAICRPFVVQYLCTWERARKIILITWSLSTCLATPTPFIVKLYSPPGQGHMECLQQSRQDIYLVLYFTYFLGVLFALPSLMMIFTYGCSCYTLWKSTVISKKLKGDGSQCDVDTGGEELSSKESDEIKSRKRVIKGLLCIVILFITCWGPPLMIQLLCVMSIVRRYCRKYRLALETLTYISAAVNPYLFMAMSSQFCGPIRSKFGRSQYRSKHRTYSTTTTGNQFTETSLRTSHQTSTDHSKYA